MWLNNHAKLLTFPEYEFRPPCPAYVITMLYLRPRPHAPEQKSTTMSQVTRPPNGRFCPSVAFRVRRLGSTKFCNTFHCSVLIPASTRLGALQAQRKDNMRNVKICKKINQNAWLNVLSPSNLTDQKTTALQAHCIALHPPECQWGATCY